MPKRKSKGQQRKTNRGPQKRELEYKDDGQEYAQVIICSRTHQTSPWRDDLC